MTKSIIIRKNRVKLAWRIGCIFLKPKVTKRPYKQVSRSLDHLKKDQNYGEEEENQVDLDGDDYSVEQLEFITQLLLESLKDEDATVRWSAAKGLCRITQRYTKEISEQIIEKIIKLFSESQTDSTWHGGCLVLAELCKSGLILPQKLETIVPILDKALIFDLNRGYSSVGSNVREAACYVIWVCSREFTSDNLKPDIFE